MKQKVKRKLLILGVCILGTASLVAVLNIEVSSRQGINYVVRTVKMPLYIKIMEFLDRDYHYKKITNEIVKDCYTVQEKVLALFEWTHENIKEVPEDFPIVDDHVWHIIIRGYGARDQLSDVFTTLCNYANIDAFFSPIYTKDRADLMPLSFVKINNHWRAFVPHNGVYFKNKAGELASVAEIKTGAVWFIESLGQRLDVDYEAYLNNLPSVKEMGLKRANIQSPLNRLLFQLKERCKTDKK